MKPGIVIRERRLVPVTNKMQNLKLEKLIGKIERSTLRDEVLICAMVSPDGKTGVFLDDTGREYLIKEKEFDDKITYINAKYVKKQVDRFVNAKRNVVGYKDLIEVFLRRSDVPKRYPEWSIPDEFVPAVEPEEAPEPGDSSLTEESKYQKGKTYISDDGEFRFRVIKPMSGKVRIQDLESGKEFTVEISDLELMNADLDEEQKFQKGKTYISDDKSWRFKILKASSGSAYLILDLNDNKKYIVDASDMELMHPVLDEDSVTSGSIASKIDQNMGKKIIGR